MASRVTSDAPDAARSAPVPAGAGAVLSIDLDAVRANWRLLADRAAPATCAAVVKADAYGLGAAPIARALFDAGCRTFFVAQIDEAVALRAIVPDAATVAVLNGLSPGTETAFAAHGIVPVLNHLGEIDAWSAAARDQGIKLPAFVHIDTGMNRLGLGPDELARLAADHRRLDGIEIRAYMSHLIASDEADTPLTDVQHARFVDALGRLPRARASLANSSGIFRGSHLHFDLVRPGAALYGVNPTPETANPMRPVIRLAARVLQVRNVDSPMTVGYGATHAVGRPGKVATIAVGYADGYMRSLSGRGHAVAAGVAVPIIGRVSMDLITIDITDAGDDAVQPGDLVDLIGPHRTVDDVARDAGTIGYEVLTSLGHRYRRVYGASSPLSTP